MGHISAAATWALHIPMAALSQRTAMPSSYTTGRKSARLWRLFRTTSSRRANWHVRLKGCHSQADLTQGGEIKSQSLNVAQKPCANCTKLRDPEKWPAKSKK